MSTEKTDNKITELKKVNVIAAFKILFPKLIRLSPVLLTLCCVISIFHGLFWGIQTMFQQRFFDRATEFASGDAALGAVIIALVWLGSANITCQLLNGVGNFIPNILFGICDGKLSKEIHQKIARIAPVMFEDTDRLDDINKANQGKNNATFFVFIFLTIFTFYIPYFIFMGWYMFTLKPSLAWAIIIVFIPTALTQLIRSKVFSKLEDKSAPVRRQFDYYESCMVGREYFKETRLLGGFNFFKKLYMDALKQLNTLSFKANVKTNCAELAMKLLTVAGYIGILYMLFDALMKGEITVGAFAAVFNSIGLLYSIMEEVVCRHIGNIAQNLGTIQNYINFLKLPEIQGTKTELPKDYDISLRDVSFAYPKAEKKALNKVSLTIKNGETVAIVGENGSGKSTLIRLITGLYLPSEGSVAYGDISTGELVLSSLANNISAVFQKFCRYQMTLSENISISNVNRDICEEELDKVTGMAGLSKEDECFTDGYNTMLSREFDGVDLSGGEWQRIAIARAFYRKHQLIILDEPTAAIDPLEETRIYNRFAEISKDKTAIIVTHRLGSVKLADRIVVMKDGEVAEVGTHSELMDNNGEYARMYTSQSKWYSND
jgi:ATP-binding cassette subfamily B protein